MNVEEAIVNRRTIRYFSQKEIEYDTLKELVNLGRLAPSGGNLQPIKYLIVHNKEDLRRVHKNVRFAAYLSDFKQMENQKPTAYIIVLADTDIRKSGYDLEIGAAVQNIMLGSYELGIGTCFMGAINRNEIRKEFNIPERYVISCIVALGYMDEKPVYEDRNDIVKYYRDRKGTLHVPKRKLENVIVNFK